MAHGAAAAGPDHQQIIRLAGGRDEHLAGFAAEHLRLGRLARRGDPAPGQSSAVHIRSQAASRQIWRR